MKKLILFIILCGLMGCTQPDAQADNAIIFDTDDVEQVTLTHRSVCHIEYHFGELSGYSCLGFFDEDGNFIPDMTKKERFQYTKDQSARIVELSGIDFNKIIAATLLLKEESANPEQ